MNCRYVKWLVQRYVASQPDRYQKGTLPLKLRLQWAKSISELVLDRGDLSDVCGVRDWDLFLKLDGSVVNCAENASPTLPIRLYPARYQIPSVILDRLSSSPKKTERAELFALGSILYQVLSSEEIFSCLNDAQSEAEIQSRFVRGEFPENVWGLPDAVRILGFWCPRFTNDMVAPRSRVGKLLSHS